MRTHLPLPVFLIAVLFSEKLLRKRNSMSKFKSLHSSKKPNIYFDHQGNNEETK